jgi:hypothetical protein
MPVNSSPFEEWSPMGPWLDFINKQLDEQNDRDTYDRLEQEMLGLYSEDQIGASQGDDGSEERKRFLRKAWEKHSLKIVLDRIWGSNQSRPDLEADTIGGTADDGIDSYVFDDSRSSHQYGLTIIQSKWYEMENEDNMRTMKHEHVDKLPADGMKIIGDFAAGEWNDDWVKLRDDFQAKREEDEEYPIRLIFVGGNNSDNPEVIRRHEENNIRIIDFEALAKHLMAAPVHNLGQLEGTISGNFVTRKGSKATIGTTTAWDLCEFFDDDESDKRKQKTILLEYNVRVRLTTGGKKTGRAAHVLDKTKKTIEDNSEDFVSRNNGLLITAFTTTRKLEGNILEEEAEDDVYGIYSDTVEMNNPQIVNGGQTINALFDFYQKGEEDIDNILKAVEIPLKISRVENEEEMLEIAYASNNQNPVNDRDLKSRDARMMQLAKDAFGEEVVGPKAFNDDVWLEVRAGELDYKEETGADISNFGVSPKRMLSNEVSGKIAWALLGGGFQVKQSNDDIWGDLFEYLFWKEKNLEDFPTSKISLENGKFFDNRTNSDILREYAWGQLVWNIANAISSVSTGQLSKISDQPDKQEEWKCRTEIVPRMQTIVLTVFNAVLKNKSNNDFVRKKEIVQNLFGNFSQDFGQNANPSLKRVFLKKQTIKSWLNQDNENWNILVENQVWVEDSAGHAVALATVIRWIEMIVTHGCKLYRRLNPPPADFKGDKKSYYTNGGGQSEFITKLWGDVLDNISKFQIDDGQDGLAEQAVATIAEEDVEFVPDWYEGLVYIVKSSNTVSFQNLQKVYPSMETEWGQLTDDKKDNVLRWFAIHTDLVGIQPEWMS